MTGPFDHGRAGELVLKKQREKRLSVNEDEEMPKRALRSRKSDIQDMNCLHACVEEKQEAASNFRNAEMEAFTEDCAEEALVKKSATKCKKKEEICMEPMESYPENGAYKVCSSLHSSPLHMGHLKYSFPILVALQI